MCSPCPAGFGCPAVCSEPVPCTAGFACEAGSVNSTAAACPAGEWLVSRKWPSDRGGRVVKYQPPTTHAHACTHDANTYTRRMYAGTTPCIHTRRKNSHTTYACTLDAIHTTQTLTHDAMHSHTTQTLAAGGSTLVHVLSCIRSVRVPRPPPSSLSEPVFCPAAFPILLLTFWVYCWFGLVWVWFGLVYCFTAHAKSA